MSSKETCPISTLSGFATSLPTPFSDGAIDEKSFAALCDWQIAQGVSALVVNGSTGEAPTLCTAERRRLIGRAVEVAAGRVPVIAGAGSNSTAHAIELARQAEAAGAQGLLVVAPYYDRPSQEGLFRHFTAIHDETKLPILLYDIPARKGCAITVDTLCRLVELPRIAGLVDETSEFDRPRKLRRMLGTEFRLFTGDDLTALDYFVRGGDGCISVVANVIPQVCVQLHDAWRQGKPAEARLLARTLAPLTAALCSDSNPVRVKVALSLMGRTSAEVRLPLCSASCSTRDVVARALERFGLIANVAGDNSVGHRAVEARIA